MRNVLILTIDCWNQNICTSSASSYSTLFSGIDEYNITNIYIREEIPNDPCCSRYFQISEQKVIKSVLNKGIHTGKEVFCVERPDIENLELISLHNNFYAKHRGRHYYFKKAVRELIWWCSAWRSQELDDFLESVAPDIVIFSMEGYIHFNRLCRYALEKTGAKGIGYFWDDNFTYKQRPQNVGYKLLRFFQRKSLVRLANNTTSFWAISPKTKREADEYFGICCEVISKPVGDDNVLTVSCNDDGNMPIRMLYTGNLMIGRMNTIRMVARTLRDINQDAIKVSLDIFSPTPIPEDLKTFGYGVTFHDPIPQKEISRAQRQADILLFAEDVVGEERYVSRLSFSTKIPDYLNCGRCIIAIGDHDTAPMEYFSQQEIALCASSAEELRRHIEQVLERPEIMEEYGKRAILCAQENHNRYFIQEKIKSNIQKICENE